MTDEDINATIAEACGILSKDQWGKIYKTPQGYVRDVPDYLNDLNAMHEAEKVLLKDGHESDLWLEYLSNLVICAPAGLSSHATARQRAEAFLKTKRIIP